MVNDGVINHQAYFNFSIFVQENVVSTFCMSWFTCAKHLEWYCAEFYIFSFCIGFAMMFFSSNILKLACYCTLQAFQGEPSVLVQSVPLEHAMRVLSHLCEDVKKRTKDKGLDLLVAISQHLLPSCRQNCLYLSLCLHIILYRLQELQQLTM